MLPLSNLAYPALRLRRNRNEEFIRKLTQEHWLSANDLVYPLFIVAGHNREEAIPSLPRQKRFSIDRLLPYLESLHQLGLLAIALFPVIEEGRDNAACASYDAQGLIPSAVRIIKKTFPQLGIFTDVALDPYTSHGQDGIIDENGYVLNDITNAILVKQALCYAAAGADFVCPSDMMDGRIGAIRHALEHNGFVNTGIMAYAAKYASQFYGPFRDAVGSKVQLAQANKLTYQLNPANSQEALREVALDVAEGADIVMVKPGLFYLDIVYQVKQAFKLPTAVYQVSGEYAMLQAAAAHSYLDYNACLTELMVSCKRAGADIIWTYAAADLLKVGF